MIHSITRKPALAVTALLALTFVGMPPAKAQDPLGGAILGGAAGAIVGGAVTGRAGGAAIGAVIGAATGATIAAEAQRNGNGYYAWHDGCYIQRPDGYWVRVRPRYCY
ncbi:MAG: glycine zipper domain-containing protein [Xanthobacteraceae bacterium]|nr:glycine zipper domain-containing protein [Xanthobacteraceae bacterium]